MSAAQRNVVIELQEPDAVPKALRDTLGDPSGYTLVRSDAERAALRTWLTTMNIAYASRMQDQSLVCCYRYGPRRYLAMFV